MDERINIKHYSAAQLLDALSGVDDELYFDNALLIYQTLLSSKGWHFEEVTAKRLGYAHNWPFDWL